MLTLYAVRKSTQRNITISKLIHSYSKVIHRRCGKHSLGSKIPINGCGRIRNSRNENSTYDLL